MSYNWKGRKYQLENMYRKNRPFKTKALINDSGILDHWNLDKEIYTPLLMDYYSYWYSYCIVGNPFSPAVGAVVALAALASADCFANPSIYIYDNKQYPPALDYNHIEYIKFHNVISGFGVLKSLVSIKKIAKTLDFWSRANKAAFAQFDDRIYHLILMLSVDYDAAREHEKLLRGIGFNYSNNNNNDNQYDSNNISSKPAVSAHGRVRSFTNNINNTQAVSAHGRVRSFTNNINNNSINLNNYNQIQSNVVVSGQAEGGNKRSRRRSSDKPFKAFYSNIKDYDE